MTTEIIYWNELLSDIIDSHLSFTQMLDAFQEMPFDQTQDVLQLYKLLSSVTN